MGTSNLILKLGGRKSFQGILSALLYVVVAVPVLLGKPELVQSVEDLIKALVPVAVILFGTQTTIMFEDSFKALANRLGKIWERVQAAINDVHDKIDNLFPPIEKPGEGGGEGGTGDAPPMPAPPATADDLKLPGNYVSPARASSPESKVKALDGGLTTTARRNLQRGTH